MRVYHSLYWDLRYLLMWGCPRGTVAPWSIHPLNWERCILLFSCKRYLDRWSGHIHRSFCQFSDPTYWYSRGFLRNTYLSFWLGRWGLFIVSRAPSLWRWEDSLTFAVMMVLKGWQNHHYPTGGWQRLLGGWFFVPLVFSLYRRCKADRLKRPGNVLSSMLLAKWVMIVREIWSGILFGTTTTGSGLDVRIEGKMCHVSIGAVPCGLPDRRWDVPCVHRRSALWKSGQKVGRAMCPPEECLVRPGWTATCTLRGGPYSIHGRVTLPLPMALSILNSPS